MAALKPVLVSTMCGFLFPLRHKGSSSEGLLPLWTRAMQRGMFCQDGASEVLGSSPALPLVAVWLWAH